MARHPGILGVAALPARIGSHSCLLVGVVAEGDVATLQVASEDLEAHVPHLDHWPDAPYRLGAQDNAVAVAAHVHGVAFREVLVREELPSGLVNTLIVGHAGGHVSLQGPLRSLACLLHARSLYPLLSASPAAPVALQPPFSAPPAPPAPTPL